MAKDYYDVLGVSRDADQEEIKRAYREKARKYHPDASDHENAEERFKEIQEAYDTLSDEEKRQAYDRMGHQQYNQAKKQGFDPSDGGFGGGAGGMGGQGQGMGGFEGGSFEEIFQNLFGGGMGGGRGDASRRSGGDETRTSVEISLEEAFEGAEREVTFPTRTSCDTCGGSGAAEGSEVERCSTCGGSGQTRQKQQTPFGQATTVRTCPDCRGSGRSIEEPCPDCGGDGEKRERVTRSVEIPAGVEDGTTLRLQTGGSDLYIDVHVADHDTFERDGADVHYVHPISFPQAVFGDTVRVPTLEGEVEMEIPEGTQSAETFRLGGKGMPRMRRRGRGDQYVRVEVVTPDPGDLNEEEREALYDFAEAGGDEIEVDEGIFEKLKRGVFS
ncbi:MAG: molecular chaperone DnaJ [Halobacteria archaeon]|nr:molecular chaperone DnaJ [Halobacteria archaeon]